MDGRQFGVEPLGRQEGTMAGKFRMLSCTLAPVLLCGGVLGIVGIPFTPAAASPTAWSIVPSPNTSVMQANVLNGVSCTSASACIAAGYYYNGSYDQTLVEQWNGTTWSIVPSPNTSSSQHNDLYGVSCTSASACTAVGNYSNGSYDQTLVEQWNGTTWSIVSSPDTSSSQDNDLNGVSCFSASSCTAVGDYYTGSYNQTLIEQWNGSAWSIVPSPNTDSTKDNQLTSVSCLSPSSCTAVGYANSGTVDQTLIEQWNGSTWSIQSSPDTDSTFENWLYGVSCTSATACTAVGYVDTLTAQVALAEQWNGSAWSIVPTPNPNTSGSNYFNSVSCSSANSCTAVGFYFGIGTPNLTFIEQWNGSSWSIASSPNASIINANDLNGVACTSTSACTGVGEYFNGSVHQTLIELLPSLPAVSSVSPAIGPTTGGTNVSIDGVNLAGATAVHFGSVASPSFNVTSDTTMSAQAPAGVSGTVDVTVTSPRGTSATSSADQFSYRTPGYDLAGSDGGVFVFPIGQSSGFFGSLPGLGVKVNNIVGIVPTNNFSGYNLVGSDGGVFVFPVGQSAGFYGSLPGLSINVNDIVGIVPTNNYTGYDLVGHDGGVFVFPVGQSSGFFGSLPSLGVQVNDIVGIVATPGGGGYFLVGKDGGVFTFGNAPFFGSLPGIGVSVNNVTGIASNPDGKGYYVVGANGAIYAFGDATSYGSLPGLGVSVSNIVAIVPTPSGKGYWLIGNDGGVFAFGDATSQGSLPGLGVSVTDVVGAVPAL